MPLSDTSPEFNTLSVTAELRIPSQERGARRVEAILDAAASLVVEVGAEGVTVQMLAERAHTSKGSLYHFFPDVPSVLRALADRHLSEIKHLLDERVRDQSLDWQAMDAREVVRHVLLPLDYLEQNSDLLALVRAPGVLPRSARAMQPMLDFASFVLSSRFPRMERERCESRSATIIAVIDGVVGSASRGCVHGGASVRRELDELLTIYITELGTA